LRQTSSVDRTLFWSAVGTGAGSTRLRVACWLPKGHVGEPFKGVKFKPHHPAFCQGGRAAALIAVIALSFSFCKASAISLCSGAREAPTSGGRGDREDRRRDRAHTADGVSDQGRSGRLGGLPGRLGAELNSVSACSHRGNFRLPRGSVFVGRGSSTIPI